MWFQITFPEFDPVQGPLGRLYTAVDVAELESHGEDVQVDYHRISPEEESSLGLRWKSTGFEREGYRFLAFASMDSVRNRSLGAVALRLVGDAREEHFEGFYFRPGDPAATYPLLSAYPARASHDELAVQTSEIYAQALGNTSAALPNEFLPVLAGTGNPATTEGKRKLVEQIKRMKRRVVLAVGDSASDMALWDAAVL